MLDRRRFLTTGSGLAAAIALPRDLFRQLERVPSRLPDAALHDKDPDAYWAAIRKKFVIPRDEIYLNNGTVGSCPEPVLRAVFDGYNTLEQMADADPEDYPIWGYGPWNQFRDPLAEFVGLQARRDRPRAQQHRGQQLHGQRHRYEAGRRSAHDRPGAPGR